MKIKFLQRLFNPRPRGGVRRFAFGLAVAMCGVSLSAVAQNSGRFTATGIVTDKELTPLAGVAIVVDGTARGTTTGIDGRFSVHVPNDQARLTVSYIGFEDQTVVPLRTGDLHIVLNESTAIEEVVVSVGYGQVRKRDLTGAVASVSGAELSKVPVATAAEALTGRVAGVRVVSTDGEPGADLDITVRGGMSVTQSKSPLYVIDGFVSDLGLMGVDPNEIESIDVLKDASTTAIYGAQGANGVVLITTKSASKGKTHVTYNGYVGFRQLSRSYDVMNALDYVKMQYEMALRADGGVPGSTLEAFIGNYGEFADYERLYRGKGMDWQREVFGGNALYHSHNVSISGGTERSSVLASYSNNLEEGILINTKNARHNFMVKFDHKISDRFTFRTKVSYYINNKTGDITSGSTLNSTLQFRPVLNKEASIDEMLDALEGNGELTSPIESQFSKLRLQTKNSLMMNAALDYRITPKLVLSLSGSGTWNHGRNDSFDDSKSSSAQTSGGASGSQRWSSGSKWQNTNTLSYNDKFGRHNLSVMVGTELIFSKSQSLTAKNSQFPEINFGIYDLSLGTNPSKPATTWEEVGMASYFGRIAYNYDDRYLFTFNVRADGSSKFARPNRWGIFPSASAAWRIHEERFLQGAKSWLDNLKLRVSYGQTGNNNIGSNRYLSIFQPTTYADGALEIPALSVANLANPTLKWETTVAANIGLDFGLFHGRLNGSLEIYQNKTKDLLLNANIPITSGYKKQTMNIGSIRGRGIELTLNSVNLKSKNFQWTTDFNISFNRNKVISLTGETESEYMLYKSGVGSYMEDYFVGVGYPTGKIYGYVTDGFYGVDDFDAVFDADKGIWKYTLKEGIPYCTITGDREKVQPGSIRLKNLDGEGNITDADRTIIGDTNPDFLGGFNNTFTYKGFDLSIFMNFQIGNDVLNYQRARLMSSYDRNRNQHADLVNRFTWIDDNGSYVSEPAALKALNAHATTHAVKSDGPESNITITTSDMVEEGSFLRINNITLGYTFRTNWLRKAGISSLRIYGTAYNVYTVTGYSGYDPDVNRYPNGGLTPGVDWSAYPRTRSYIFGVNLTF